ADLSLRRAGGWLRRAARPRSFPRRRRPALDRPRQPIALMPVSAGYRPDPAHPALGDAFFDPVTPARFPRHVLRYRNQRWAERVGLGELTPAEWQGPLPRLVPLPRN